MVLFVTGMLVDLSVAIKQVTVSVSIMQLEVSAAHIQVAVSAAKMWLTIFVVSMQQLSAVLIIMIAPYQPGFMFYQVHANEY